eukprot:5446066-Pleurochrysis_carterae.AAC.2
MDNCQSLSNCSGLSALPAASPSKGTHSRARIGRATRGQCCQRGLLVTLPACSLVVHLWAEGKKYLTTPSGKMQMAKSWSLKADTVKSVLHLFCSIAVSVPPSSG